jgi:hypothetical protein
MRQNEMRRDAVQMRQKKSQNKAHKVVANLMTFLLMLKTAQNQEINTSKFQRLQLFFNTIQRCSLNWQIKSK